MESPPKQNQKRDQGVTGKLRNFCWDAHLKPYARKRCWECGKETDESKNRNKKINKITKLEKRDGFENSGVFGHDFVLYL